MFGPLYKPAIVYQARNKKNGKRYIGATGQRFERRQYQHVREALIGKGKGAFAHALRKYGADAFEWSVLSTHECGRDAMNEECRLIRETSPDYNSTLGGQGFHARTLSQASRDKIAAAHRGNTYALGHRHSKHTKELLRQLGFRDKDKWLQRSYLGPAASARRVVCINDGLIYVFRYEGDAHETGAEAHALAVKPKKNNKTGTRGVYRYFCEGRDTGKYRAERRIKGKRIRLGIFDTAEEGHAAYMAAGENH